MFDPLYAEEGSRQSPVIHFGSAACSLVEAMLNSLTTLPCRSYHRMSCQGMLMNEGL
jgi:hypothetical protein